MRKSLKRRAARSTLLKTALNPHEDEASRAGRGEKGKFRHNKKTLGLPCTEDDAPGAKTASGFAAKNGGLGGERKRSKGGKKGRGPF